MTVPTYPPDACPLCAQGVRTRQARLASGSRDRRAVTDAAARRTLSLTLAYEGTAFAGWQRQPGARTVQAVVEEALAAIEERPVTLVAAGRTDAGVHARGRWPASTWTTGWLPAVLVRALNVRLPDDVRVRVGRRRAARLRCPPRRAGQGLPIHHRARRGPGPVRATHRLARPAAARCRRDGARPPRSWRASTTSPRSRRRAATCRPRSGGSWRRRLVGRGWRAALPPLSASPARASSATWSATSSARWSTSARAAGPPRR